MTSPVPLRLSAVPACHFPARPCPHSEPGPVSVTSPDLPRPVTRDWPGLSLSCPCPCAAPPCPRCPVPCPPSCLTLFVPLSSRPAVPVSTRPRASPGVPVPPGAPALPDPPCPPAALGPEPRRAPGRPGTTRSASPSAAPPPPPAAPRGRAATPPTPAATAATAVTARPGPATAIATAAAPSDPAGPEPRRPWPSEGRGRLGGGADTRFLEIRGGARMKRGGARFGAGLWAGPGPRRRCRAWWGRGHSPRGWAGMRRGHSGRGLLCK